MRLQYDFPREAEQMPDTLEQSQMYAMVLRGPVIKVSVPSRIDVDASRAFLSKQVPSIETIRQADKYSEVPFG